MERRRDYTGGHPGAEPAASLVPATRGFNRRVALTFLIFDRVVVKRTSR